MDGNVLAFIVALAKKISIQNGSIGITSIDNSNSDLTFHLANGQNYTITLPIPKVDLENVMKITDYDKDKDGIIDKSDYANLSKESEHSKTSDIANNSKHSKLSDDSVRLDGELAENYFNKNNNNTDDIVEGNINKFISADEKVKLNQMPSNINELLNKKMDISKYDSDSDGIVDIAKTLEGLRVNINELNQLQGIKDNIQKQINNLSNIGNFTGSANTYKDIATVNPKPIEKDMIIVIKDETHEDTSTIYIYNGKQWVYSGTFTATIRDFNTNPIDLNKETLGILPKSRIDLQDVARTNDLEGKMDKISGTTNNIITFDTDGNIKDSGVNINNIQAKKHDHNTLYYTKDQSDNRYVTKNDLQEQIKNIDIKGIDDIQNNIKTINNNINTLQTSVKDLQDNQLNNKNILEKLSDDGTGLKYNGKEIGSNSKQEAKLDIDTMWDKFEL